MARKEKLWQITIVGVTDGEVDEALIRENFQKRVSIMFSPKTFKIADIRSLSKPKQGTAGGQA